MPKVNFTTARIEGASCPPDKDQVFLWDSKTPGLGLRVTKAGAKSYIFQAKLHGASPRVTIGDPRSWTIAQAQEEARRLQVQVDQGIDPRQQKAEQRAALEAQREAAEFDLARLCDEYTNYLESLGRNSHKDVRSIFKLHVKEAWSKVAALPAKDVTSEQFANMMRRLLDAGKGRTSNKLRSYLHAAYEVARAAKSKPSIPEVFKSFEISTNSVSDTAPDEAQNNSDKNPLSEQQLRIYWDLIRDRDDLKGAVLRVHLLTGSQRIAQLVRLFTTDISKDEILLFDGKGRPGRAPREHPIPLIRAAAKALSECHPQGTYALSTDGGETHIDAQTLSGWAVEIVGDAIPDFQTKRLRSGVETILAKAKVSRETRGRLQSHGISGVQNRSYDGHDYIDVKKEALQALYRLLERPQATTALPFKRRRQRLLSERRRPMK
ncbi:integrase arm-type DNA-binding domain-containing protein [Achromobacter denitrificans]